MTSSSPPRIRTCIRCHQSRPDGEFYAARVGRRNVCKRCRQQQVETRERNMTPEQRAARARSRHGDSLRRRYGMTLAEYDALFDAQGGRCAGCQRLGKRGGRESGSLHVDHNHSTDTVRGLLCTSCNGAIGRVVENPDTLRRLAGYLEASVLIPR